MNKKEGAEQLFAALTEIDAAYILEAAPKAMASDIRGRRRHLGRKVFVILLAASISISVVAAIAQNHSTNLTSEQERLVPIVREKMAATNPSDERIEILSRKLSDEGFAADDLKDCMPIGVNASGETYGADIFDPDLVAVVSDQGKDGYIRNERLEPDDPSDAPEFNRKEANKKEPVYKSDGVTVIGTLTAGDGEN